MERRRLSGIALATALLLLTGCKEVLYSDISQIEANEMVAVLAASQITATREQSKDGQYAILVAPDDVPLAVALLRDQGLPREQFESLGEVFGGDGIVGTPFEEQARFLHALNQELSAAVTAIAGVRSAKVLVTVPPAERFRTTPPRASAAIVVHHEAGFESRRHVPTIKNLVAHAVPALDYDAVEVALFPAGGPLIGITRTESEAPNATTLAPQQGWQVAAEKSRIVLWISIAVALAVVAVLLAPLFRRRRLETDT
ncbi:MAG: type III secretion inner membrane ring lipoprotein SctJ [Pseudomonadota bacterium]